MFREMVHNVRPCGINVRLPASGSARQNDGVEDLLEVAVCERRQAVAKRDNLALLGEAHAASEAPRRLGKNGAVRAPAAASDGTAAAVEQAQGDARLAARRRKAFLRAIKRPVRREESSVLCAVGIAEHDFLQAALLRLEGSPIDLMLKHGLQKVRTAAEVLDGFKERHHVDVAVPRRRTAPHPKRTAFFC